MRWSLGQVLGYDDCYDSGICPNDCHGALRGEFRPDALNQGIRHLHISLFLRALGLGVVITRAGVRRGDAWRYKAGSICTRHGRYSVGPCPALRSNQSRGSRVCPICDRR